MPLPLFRINPASGVPIYLQLMEQIRHAIESCVLAPGAQLPGIRTLAQELVVSPNTVVKAYTELAREGTIELRQGAGAFVVDQELARGGKQIRQAKTAAREFVARLRRLGFSEGEIRRFVDAELDFENHEARA